MRGPCAPCADSTACARRRLRQRGVRPRALHLRRAHLRRRRAATARRRPWTAVASAPPARPASSAAGRRTAKSGVCLNGRCAAPACGDGVRNGAETDTDCGGLCRACGDGLQCGRGGDCQARSARRAAASRRRARTGPPTAWRRTWTAAARAALRRRAPLRPARGLPGRRLPARLLCPAGLRRSRPERRGVGRGLRRRVRPVPRRPRLRGPADCQSGACGGGVCTVPACDDGVLNGDGKSDVDCGGACAGCAQGAACGSTSTAPRASASTAAAATTLPQRRARSGRDGRGLRRELRRVRRAKHASSTATAPTTTAARGVCFVIPPRIDLVEPAVVPVTGGVDVALTSTPGTYGAADVYLDGVRVPTRHFGDTPPVHRRPAPAGPPSSSVRNPDGGAVMVPDALTYGPGAIQVAVQNALGPCDAFTCSATGLDVFNPAIPLSFRWTINGLAAAGDAQLAGRHPAGDEVICHAVIGEPGATWEVPSAPFVVTGAVGLVSSYDLQPQGSRPRRGPPVQRAGPPHVLRRPDRAAVHLARQRRGRSSGRGPRVPRRACARAPRWPASWPPSPPPATSRPVLTADPVRSPRPLCHPERLRRRRVRRRPRRGGRSGR
ncbi:MAG: hypothetical protein R3F43_11895 [bacterium]